MGLVRCGNFYLCFRVSRFFMPHAPRISMFVACRVSLSRVGSSGVTVAQNSWLIGRGAARPRGRASRAPRTHTSLARRHTPHTQDTRTRHAWHRPPRALSRRRPIYLASLATLASRSRCRSGQRVVGLRARAGCEAREVFHERGVSLTLSRTCSVSSGPSGPLYFIRTHSTLRKGPYMHRTTEIIIRIQTVNVSKDQSK